MIQIILSQEHHIGTSSYYNSEHRAFYDNIEDAKKAFNWLNTQMFGQLVDEYYDWDTPHPYAHAKRGGKKCMTLITLHTITATNETQPFEVELMNAIIATYMTH